MALSYRNIPFNRPLSARAELLAATAMIAKYKDQAPPHFVNACASILGRACKTAKVHLTSSCTQSLEMAVLLAGVGPGDEVIMPSFTFVSTANAVVLRGATPVFVDIRMDTCNMDESLIPQAITPRTRAIIPVHYAGVACEMGAIMEVAEQAGLVVIEDAAHSVLASWRNMALGAIGHIGAYSFHSTKNISSGGEGGALLINDSAYEQQADIVRANGTNRDAFFRGEAPCYEWIRAGGNYTMSEVQAAVLWAQLQQAETITASRVAVWEYYFQQLQGICFKKGILLPTVPAGCQHNGHIFYVLMPDARKRQAMMARLADAGVPAPSHYEPLHRSPAGRELSRFSGSDQRTLRVASTIMRLPVYHDISKDDQDYIIDHFISAAKAVC